MRRYLGVPGGFTWQPRGPWTPCRAPRAWARSHCPSNRPTRRSFAFAVREDKGDLVVDQVRRPELAVDVDDEAAAHDDFRVGGVHEGVALVQEVAHHESPRARKLRKDLGRRLVATESVAPIDGHHKVAHSPAIVSAWLFFANPAANASWKSLAAASPVATVNVAMMTIKSLLQTRASVANTPTVHKTDNSPTALFSVALPLLLCEWV